ncbi:MAG: GNAT family N-acetyltransferase [Patescibacteria group bacterium]
MDYKIKKAKLEHLKDIQRLHKSLFDNEIKNFNKSLNPKWIFGKAGTQYYKDLINKRNLCAFVALVGNKVAGYLAGEIIREPVGWRKIKKQAELDNMFVLPQYRGKKIGTGLVKAFLSWAKKKEATNIKVAASAKNQKAISFYQKHGFKDYELILEINFAPAAISKKGRKKN